MKPLGGVLPSAAAVVDNMGRIDYYPSLAFYDDGGRHHLLEIVASQASGWPRPTVILMNQYDHFDEKRACVHRPGCNVAHPNLG
jgi:hypothetical protein